MSQKTVLIVDDSSLARMMMKNIIVQAYPHWKVTEAGNGDEALTIARDSEIAIALIDFNMPGINGIELSAQLMTLYPAISIHLVTANIQEKMQQRAEAMGVGFIRKPVSRDALARVFAGVEGGQ
ncbi:MAG: response regulator [Candidatus Magnetobacterium sp. LHC-1]|uniref:Response regulator n=1 Tax=Candidatus Magnetobacterium casense TaxID=1455061 RepID=A0ABS6S3H3_9BACT|nr:response regulator [Candidatus Magnetobacterium casensis]MBF0606577.1 response regulator [Nitrospirota bacterium]MBV6342908.1 response regulator [Candidatus Magnetobacterium casensis]